MSRLQVGGLALYIPDGSIFELIGFVGDYKYKDDIHHNCWRCKSNKLEVLDNGYMSDNFLVPEKYLMPLGDKQTQDELAKEKELESV